MPTANKERLAWDDRFRSPTVDQLRAPMIKQLVGAFDSARERLTDLGLSEEVIWKGIPWRWTVAFTRSDDDERGSVYLVPQPARPYLVLAMPMDVLTKLPVRRLSKFVRDAILHAPCVAGIYWPQWDIQTKGQVEEVMAVVGLNHGQLQPQN